MGDTNVYMCILQKYQFLQVIYTCTRANMVLCMLLKSLFCQSLVLTEMCLNGFKKPTIS